MNTNMKKFIALVVTVLAMYNIGNAQTDTLCPCNVNLASADVQAKLKLVKAKAIGKNFKGEAGKPVTANRYVLTYKYTDKGVVATIVTDRLPGKNTTVQYAKLITVKGPSNAKSLELLGCPVDIGNPKKGKTINCTR